MGLNTTFTMGRYLIKQMELYDLMCSGWLNPYPNQEYLLINFFFGGEGGESIKLIYIWLIRYGSNYIFLQKPLELFSFQPSINSSFPYQQQTINMSFIQGFSLDLYAKTTGANFLSFPIKSYPWAEHGYLYHPKPIFTQSCKGKQKGSFITISTMELYSKTVL